MSKSFTGDALSAAVGCMTSMAPEVYKGEGYAPSIDVFSYAMVLFELFAGHTPNGSTDQRKYAHAVALEGYRPEIPPSLPLCWRDLIVRCWDQNPALRPTFDQIQMQLRDFNGPLPGSPSLRSSSEAAAPPNLHLDAYQDSTAPYQDHQAPYVTGSGGIDCSSDSNSYSQDSTSSGVDIFTSDYANQTPSFD